MKILHVVPSLSAEVGGVAYAVRNMVEALAAHDCHLTIATFGENFLPVEHAEIRIFHPQNGYLFSPQFKRYLIDDLRSFDLVHIHSIWLYHSRSASKLCRRAGIPYIVSPHGMLDQWSISQKRLKKKFYFELIERKVIEKAAAIHCTLQEEVEASNIRRYNQNAVVIPLSVESDFFSVDDSTVRNPEQILFLGRLHYKKQPEVAIEAFKRIRREFPRARLVMAGTGDEEFVESLRRRCRDDSIEASVHFSGMITGPEKVDLFRESGIFVLPSLQENFGIAVAEAMSAGCHPVVSDQVALCETVRKLNRELVTGTDEGSVSKALDSALRLSEEENRIVRQKYRAYAEQNFSPSAMGKRLYDFYTEILVGM